MLHRTPAMQKLRGGSQGFERNRSDETGYCSLRKSSSHA